MRKLVVFLLLHAGSLLFGDIEVTPPVFPGANSQLESLLLTAMISAGAEVESYLDDLGEKPLLFDYMERALAGSLPWGTTDNSGMFSLSIGAFASANLPSYDIDELEDIADEFEYEDDLAAGAGASPMFAVFQFPLEKLVPGMYGRVLLSGFNLSYDEYFYRGGAFGTEIGWTVLRKRQFGRFFKWNGLIVYSGAGYAYHMIGSDIDAGVFEQEFELDPDGHGPYPGETITVRAEPSFEVSYNGYALIIPLGFSSGITAADALSFNIDLLSGYYFGASGLGIKGGDQIEVLGYLSGLIEPGGEGSIMVDYDNMRSQSGFVMPRAVVTASYQVESLRIHIPIGYSLDEFVSAGFVMEVLF